MSDAMWLHTDKEAIHAFTTKCCKEHGDVVTVTDTYKKGGPLKTRHVDGVLIEEWRELHKNGMRGEAIRAQNDAKLATHSETTTTSKPTRKRK